MLEQRILSRDRRECGALDEILDDQPFGLFVVPAMPIGEPGHADRRQVLQRLHRLLERIPGDREHELVEIDERHPLVIHAEIGQRMVIGQRLLRPAEKIAPGKQRHHPVANIGRHRRLPLVRAAVLIEIDVAHAQHQVKFQPFRQVWPLVLEHRHDGDALGHVRMVGVRVPVLRLLLEQPPRSLQPCPHLQPEQKKLQLDFMRPRHIRCLQEGYALAQGGGKSDIFGV